MFGRKKIICVAIYNDTYITIAFFTHTQNTPAKLLLRSYKEFPLEQDVIIQGRLFNVTVVKKLLITELKPYAHTASCFFGISGTLVQEQFLYSDEPILPTDTAASLSAIKTHQNGSQYVRSLPGTRHLIYSWSMPRNLLFQYQILYTSLNLIVQNGMPFWNTILTLATQFDPNKQRCFDLIQESEHQEYALQQLFSPEFVSAVTTTVGLTDGSIYQTHSLLYSIGIALSTQGKL